jgi:hypothetical protein
LVGSGGFGGNRRRSVRISHVLEHVVRTNSGTRGAMIVRQPAVHTEAKRCALLLGGVQTAGVSAAGWLICRIALASAPHGLCSYRGGKFPTTE